MTMLTALILVAATAQTGYAPCSNVPTMGSTAPASNPFRTLLSRSYDTIADKDEWILSVRPKSSEEIANVAMKINDHRDFDVGGVHDTNEIAQVRAVTVAEAHTGGS